MQEMEDVHYGEDEDMDDDAEEDEVLASWELLLSDDPVRSLCEMDPQRVDRGGLAASSSSESESSKKLCCEASESFRECAADESGASGKGVLT